MRAVTYGFFGLVGLCLMGLARPKTEQPWVIVISGDADGYLSPCGCTKPMSGGIRRLASALVQVSLPGRTLFIDNGSNIAGQDRQDELKAETFAEALSAMSVSATGYALPEAKLGPGFPSSLSNLSGNRMIASYLQKSETNPLPRFVTQGPFVIGSLAEQGESASTALREQAIESSQVVSDLLDEAKVTESVAVLLLSGNRETAIKIAKANPSLALIVYRATGAPTEHPEVVGSTWLVTPGERGKHIVTMEYSSSKFDGYRSIDLGPTYVNEPKVSKIYANYLRRVDQENLIDRLPREKTAEYAGTWKCSTCHPSETAKWKTTGHAHALGTLVGDSHGRDPECVSCHVTGLDSVSGFRSVKTTPSLANVGCESCHGPLKAHTMDPAKVKPALVGEKSCAPCHNIDHSPTFDFKTYWPKVAH